MSNALPASAGPAPINALASAGIYDHCVVCGADTEGTPAPYADAVCGEWECWLRFSAEVAS